MSSTVQLQQQAAELWKRHQFEDSILLLTRAAEADPGNLDVFLDLGSACGLRGHFRDAIRYFEKALAGAPADQRREMNGVIGMRCHAFSRYDLAIQHLSLAVKLPRFPVDAAECLADSYDHLNQSEEALDVAERALSRSKDHAGLRLLKARLLRQQGQTADAERVLRETLALGSANPNRWRCLYELGQVLDRQGRYDEAMSAVCEAKSALHALAQPWLETWQGMRSRAYHLRETVTPEHFSRWRAALSDLQPPRRIALLCGQPRSGTTLLEQALNAHPGMVSAGETFLMHDETYLPLCTGFPPETPILKVLESVSDGQLRVARENYFRRTEEMLEASIGDRLLLDKNPSLLTLLPAIFRIFPEAKFLVALRDPRDVCLSCFLLPLPPNPVAATYLSLETTVQQYETAMNFWLHVRPKLGASWLEVRYEDTVSDLGTVARRLLDFLGLAWDDRILSFQDRARGRVLRSPTYAEVVKPVHNRAVGRWQNYRKYFEPYLDRLAPFVEAFNYKQ